MEQAEIVGGTVRASVNYWDPALPRGRMDTVNRELNRMSFEAHDIEVRDMRAAKETFSLDAQGFTLAAHESKVARLPEMAETNLTAQPGLPAINKAYYEEVVPLVRKISGAREVIPQSTGLTVRFSTRSKRQSWAGTAGFVHLDVTDTSARRFLDFSLAQSGHPIKPYGRFVLYQTWRTVNDPPQDNALALCDRRSVPHSDVVFYDAVIGSEGTPLDDIEARSCKYSRDHRWWYASNMGARDILIFVGYDSAMPGAVQPFHTGFDIPGNESCAPRASLEARFFAFYD